MTDGTTGSRWARTVGVIGVATTVVLVAGWFALGAQRASAVHVLLPADALTCDGSSVRIGDVPSGYGDDVAAPLAEMLPEMQCALAFRIENRSASDVSIGRVLLPVLGPEAGGGVEAVALDGVALAPRPGEVHAIFDFDMAYPVPARSAEEFSVVFAWRSDGCSSERGSVFFRDQPTVSVNVWGRTFDRSFTGTGFGFRGTSATSCDS